MGRTGAGQRLNTAIELFEFGVSMQRQRLRRENPAAVESEIDASLTAWLLHPPGAAVGGCSAPLSPRVP